MSAEQNLKAITELSEEERFRFLVEQSTDMISRHTPTQEWTFLDVSPAVERMLGYSVQEMIGTPGYDLFHPEDADNLIKRSDSVRYRKGMYTNVYRYKHKNGHYIWLETTSRTLRDESGTPIEIICVSRDVTEQTLAQQATRRLARVVEASSDMIMFCNHKTMQLTYMNEATYITLGTEKENPVVFYLEQMFDAKIFSSLVQDALNHAATHGTWYGSIPMQLPSGRDRTAEIREVIAHRNLNDNNQVEYYSIIGRDITLRRKAEEEMKRNQLEMAHISRLMSVGEMASGLAHEINQPLAAILNYCRGSLRRIDEGRITKVDEIGKSMELITKQAKRAAEIVKRMRSFVKKTEYQRMEFSLNESCHEVAEFLKQESLDHNTSFEFELENGDLPIIADKIQIEQVLLNLIRNAIEAYSDCAKSHRPVIISTRKAKDYIYISVADHANGISAEVLEKLFEPFFTSKSTGLGMGLSISRTIIEAHGGQLWAESDGKTGTQFYIKIPAKS